LISESYFFYYISGDYGFLYIYGDTTLFGED